MAEGDVPVAPPPPKPPTAPSRGRKITYIAFLAIAAAFTGGMFYHNHHLSHVVHHSRGPLPHERAVELTRAEKDAQVAAAEEAREAAAMEQAAEKERKEEEKRRLKEEKAAAARALREKQEAEYQECLAKEHAAHELVLAEEAKEHEAYESCVAVEKEAAERAGHHSDLAAARGGGEAEAEGGEEAEAEGGEEVEAEGGGGGEGEGSPASARRLQEAAEGGEGDVEEGGSKCVEPSPKGHEVSRCRKAWEKPKVTRKPYDLAFDQAFRPPSLCDKARVGGNMSAPGYDPAKRGVMAPSRPLRDKASSQFIGRSCPVSKSIKRTARPSTVNGLPICFPDGFGPSEIVSHVFNIRDAGEKKIAQHALPVQGRDVLEKYNWGGSCAVVGNSGSMRGINLGAAIDSHDIVMRINQAPTARYADDVGTKTQFRLINHKWTMEYAKKPRSLPLERNVTLLASRARPREFMHLHGVMKSRRPDVTVLALNYKLIGLASDLMSPYRRCLVRVSKTHPAGGVAPSSGLVAILALKELCTSVAVFGIGGPRAGAYQYWTGLQVRKVGDPTHSFATEKNLMMGLQAAGLIKLRYSPGPRPTRAQGAGAAGGKEGGAEGGEVGALYGGSEDPSRRRRRSYHRL